MDVQFNETTKLWTLLLPNPDCSGHNCSKKKMSVPFYHCTSTGRSFCGDCEGKKMNQLCEIHLLRSGEHLHTFISEVKLAQS